MIINSKIDPASLEPLVGAFLYRNQVTIGAGGPYAGKSRLSLHLSVKLATGEETMLGLYPPMKVLYCSERDWAFNSEQLKTIQVKRIPENLHFFCVPDIPEKDVLRFEADPLVFIERLLLAEKWMPDLIIFDTAPQFQPSIAGKEVTNSYSFNRRELLRWKRWASKHNLAVFGLYHSPKQNDKNGYVDPFDRVLGSTAILASTVAVCVLERVNEEELKVYFRSHVSRMKTPRTFDYDEFKETTDISVAMKLTKTEEEIFKEVPVEYTRFPELVNLLQRVLHKDRSNIYRTLRTLIRKGWLDLLENEDNGDRFVRKPKSN